jgi:hypothetical protein
MMRKFALRFSANLKSKNVRATRLPSAAFTGAAWICSRLSPSAIECVLPQNRKRTAHLAQAHAQAAFVRQRDVNQG